MQVDTEVYAYVYWKLCSVIVKFVEGDTEVCKADIGVYIITLVQRDA